MHLQEAKNCIRELWLHASCVTALVSERGVGKTSAYQQVAQELDIGYMGLYAAALEGPDFMGLPDKDREKGITRYLAPQFLPTVSAVRDGLFPEKGLLVLEEINRVPSDTISVLYPLLLESRINGHQLAPGWKIGVTMNPDTMNYAVNALDDAMLDRFVVIEVSACLEDYLSYSLANQPNDDVLAFLTACPDMLLITRHKGESTASHKAPTPRGWTRVQELLNQCRLEPRLMLELVSGILGPETAAAFFGYLKNRDYHMPSAREILSGYEGVRPAVADLVLRGRMDILNLVCRQVAAALTPDPAALAQADAFVTSLPGDLGVVFFKYLMAREDVQPLLDGMPSFDAVAGILAGMMM